MLLCQEGYICSVIVSAGIHLFCHCVRRDTSALSLCQAGYICSVTVSDGIHLFCHCVRRDAADMLLCQEGYICSVIVSGGIHLIGIFFAMSIDGIYFQCIDLTFSVLHTEVFCICC